MPECTTCGGHVTHEYVRVFGDNEDSIDSCRNCRASSREQDDEDVESDEVVYLEDVLGDEARQNQQSDAEAEADRERDTATTGGGVATTERGDPDDSPAESGSGGRFGLSRIRSLFAQ